jgi:hypothetical protein
LRCPLPVNPTIHCFYTCRQYDAWLQEWIQRNMQRLDLEAHIWGAIQRAAMSKFLGEQGSHSTICLRAEPLLKQLIAADASLVCFCTRRNHPAWHSWYWCTILGSRLTDADEVLRAISVGALSSYLKRNSILCIVCSWASSTCTVIIFLAGPPKKFIFVRPTIAPLLLPFQRREGQPDVNSEFMCRMQPSWQRAAQWSFLKASTREWCLPRCVQAAELISGR